MQYVRIIYDNSLASWCLRDPLPVTGKLFYPSFPTLVRFGTSSPRSWIAASPFDQQGLKNETILKGSSITLNEVRSLDFSFDHVQFCPTFS